MGIGYSVCHAESIAADQDLQTDMQILLKQNEGLKILVGNLGKYMQEEIRSLRIQNRGLKKQIQSLGGDFKAYIKRPMIAITVFLLGYYVIKKLSSRSLGNSNGSGKRKDCSCIHLLPEPWRKLHQTLRENSEIKEDFVRHILEIHPKNDTTLNILLLGQAGSGRSSFVNACKTALLQAGRVIKIAVDGEEKDESKSLTTTPYKLKMKFGAEEKDLPVQLFDCRGLFEGNKVQTEDIKKICKGHTKSDHLVDSRDTKSGDREYREDPQEKNKIHCIVFVLAVDEKRFTKEDIEKQMKEIKDMFRKDIPQVILLTKIDQIGINDITQIFRDKRVKEFCERAASFLDLCVNDVFPQPNYSKEIVPCNYKDLITLFNIKTIMERANDRLNEPVLSDDDSL